MAWFAPMEMRLRVQTVFLTSCIAAMVGFAEPMSAAHAQMSVNPAPPLRDGSHDMEFARGKWRTDVTAFRDPFNHPDEATQLSGTKTVRPLWNGKALIEEIEADGPGGHWEAANLFLYDPKAHQWSQNYVDSSDGRFDGPPGIGAYRDGNLEFYWQATIDGRATLERGVWSDIKPNSHTYQVARSNDGGRTWHTSFIARLTRIQ
jgi:hypothetical protein